eukprot:scaffold65568_cov66-Phaeocystis_antarctica.AAC.2
MISTTGGKLNCCRVTSPGTYKSVPSLCRSGALPAEPWCAGFGVPAAPLQVASATLPPTLPLTLLGSSHRQSLKAESRPSSCTRSAEAAASSLSSACDAAGAASWVEGEQEAAAPSAPTADDSPGVSAHEFSVCTLTVGSHVTPTPPTAPALERLRPESEARRRQAGAKARLPVRLTRASSDSTGMAWMS